MKEKELWQKCAEFHGHVCPGLTVGYRAALYAIDLLGIDFSEDEQLVCISENDACGVDAIQVILGCSVGKGNLLFHITGKHAFSFYERSSGKSVRIVVKPGRKLMTRDEAYDFYHKATPEEIFNVMETRISVPERARFFDSYDCDNCGETTATNWIRLQGEKKLCLDCYTNYNRFEV